MDRAGDYPYPLDFTDHGKFVVEGTNTGDVYATIFKQFHFSLYRKPLFATQCEWQDFPTIL